MAIALDEILDRRRAERRLPPGAARRALRMSAGLSLADVAALLGVTAVTVWRWEAESRRPRGAQAKVYAQLLARLAEEGAR